MKNASADIGRVFVIVHDDDNVATILDTNLKSATLADGMRIQADVPFGHKVALRQIGQGGQVVKYGVVIGHATSDIVAGQHVHVHNVR